MHYIQYIIRFLLGDNATDEQINQIGYTSDESEYPNYKLVIYPSSFFNKDIYGTTVSLPELPLPLWENTPLLFGTPKVEKKGETVILHADIIASTYFLISRYEEMVRRDCRDAHGRFPGRESVLYRVGFINQPAVDVYGRLLRNLLRTTGVDIPEPVQKIQNIYLTHDVDILAHYRNFRGLLGGMMQGKFTVAFRSYFKGLTYDPYYTFPFLFSSNDTLKNAESTSSVESILFFKAGGGRRKEDQPISKLQSKDFSRLFALAKRHKAVFGLHASYEAGIYPNQIGEEKEKLEKITGKTIHYNRHHFLAAREPEDMQALIEAGITDDFTMGYADTAGFRLGTCRAVRWINPATQELTPLTLHPLTVMDATLSDGRYMNLDTENAFECVTKLIDVTKKYGGDVCLLWHNTSVVEGGSYHRNLYDRVTHYLKEKI